MADWAWNPAGTGPPVGPGSTGKGGVPALLDEEEKNGLPRADAGPPTPPPPPLDDDEEDAPKDAKGPENTGEVGDDADDVMRDLIPGNVGCGNGGGGSVVVVIEDEADILEVLQYNLKREGYTVVPSRDGEDGLASVRR